MAEQIAGIEIPDSAPAREATDLIRDTTPPLIFHHSRRVYLFGSLQAAALGIRPDPELLYIAALFHDTGLVPPYRGDDQRFEMDGADQARAFLLAHGIPEADADTVWTAVALHTTPEVPYRMAPEIAATTAGVETDVLGLRLGNLTRAQIDAVTAAHPRPDFKKQILRAFTEGFEHRPATTFGTVNADVLEHFAPGFRRTDFVEVIENSAWPE
ncbi:HD domain-containing protein [Streptomyces rochei]|uniref:HD domain-containing protein n=1 Tax=Streptomyces vinaceusdrappus TaxID=67376 RepID=A0ABY6C3B9_9ACTN|nr:MULTISPECIES: HD domain-containing protein [Streptomyces]MBQ0912915.1 HD domain-containing protein [Streptomyces sp. RM99]MBX4174091.1 HD domain-containing protein [Streptomyces geysiriensis]QCB26366.1 HD domain-containing protein [Streptomyces sp. SS52]QCR51204.1 HD domain-containing protein [Streptomyces sp. SGAir0924]RSS19490.1 HD domain-containing protein [Streptomyces sp. WAC08401]